MARRNPLAATISKNTLNKFSRQQLEEAFALCDFNSSGYIPVRNLKVVMRALGFEPRSDEIRNLTAKIMENKVLRNSHPDCVGIDELADLLADKMDQRDGISEMRAAFQLFDSDSKGFISVDDLRKVADELSETVDDEQLLEMINEADSCHSGHVSEADFCAIMKKTSLY
uniref:Centrin n=1 Tax=Ascaris lumbricoides TaxID=6252 RepID=A0A0M3IFS4_ASCLU